jgi:phosphoribosylformylglycinamidine synthase
MILFFGNPMKKIFALQCSQQLAAEDIQKLTWLFGNEEQVESPVLYGVPMP